MLLVALIAKPHLSMHDDSLYMPHVNAETEETQMDHEYTRDLEALALLNQLNLLMNLWRALM